MTLAQRRVLSVAASKRRATPETKKKMSEGMKGHKWSQETILRRSKALKGKKRTGKALENIRNANARMHGHASYEEIPRERTDWRGPNWKIIREEIKKKR